ncbi:MAG: CPBP family intramembrane metalloprotease, partial [Planctomycetes bacterium]|nr:CPBP family intramembrane metalloprotease [Planctomycetota bacterium]
MAMINRLVYSKFMAFASRSSAGNHEGPFRRVRVRSLLVLVGLGLIITPVFWLPIAAVVEDEDLTRQLLGIAFFTFPLWWILRQRKRANLSLMSLVGESPAPGTVVRSLTVVLPLGLASIGSVYLVYYPLSFLAPGFVQIWLLDPIYFVTPPPGTDYPVLYAALGGLAGIVIAPILEELIFRGLVLQRWAHKWGPRAGILGSSALFAVGHPDVLGAFLVGCVLSALYLRTRSLLVPIACHVANNCLSALAELVFSKYDMPGPFDVAGVAEFQSEWWQGFTCLIVAAPWVVYFLRRNWPA